MPSSHPFTSAIDDAIANLTTAIDGLDVALVNEASNLRRLIEREEAARREGLNHAAVLSGVYDGGVDVRAREHEWIRGLEQAERLSTSALFLSQFVRTYGLSMTSGTTDDLINPEFDSLPVKLAMETARESERSRLAREIHDGPAQVLANALFVVGVAEHSVKRDPTTVPEQLSTIRDLLRDGITEIRRFMFELRPSLLEDQGFVPTLRYYVSEHRRVFGTQVSLTVDDHVPILSGDQELCLFRIVQEALHNIHKHANVAHAKISLLRRDRWLVLEIVDAGRGFQHSQPGTEPGSGVGLRGMRERAALIGAGLSIDSVVAGGTRIHLTIPMSTVATADN